MLHTKWNKFKNAGNRFLSLLLSFAFAFVMTLVSEGALASSASEEIVSASPSELGAAASPSPSASSASGVQPTCDEAYYATLDYYGALQEGSVVKSYQMNGASSIRDFGTYDEVVNLTDDTEPAVSDGSVTFDFGASAPDRFYFEGKGAEPFTSLPWNLGISYRLNGVAVRAEDLAGKQGLVEINIDAYPRNEASDYCKNNCALQAVAVFNADDILSLEAPGAQVQLIGNLKTVLFLAMPGEEQHFSIRVGSDDFSFSGMTFLIVPATLSQLSQIADLRDAKEKAEDSYDKISSSLDVILNTLDGMAGSLDSTADGLDQLDKARDTISSGKGEVYGSEDTAINSLNGLAGSLGTVEGHLNTASQALTDTTGLLTKLTDNAVALKTQLKQTREVTDDIQMNVEDLIDLIEDYKEINLSPYTISKNIKTDLGDLNDNLDDLQTSLATMKAVLSALSQSSLSSIDEVTLDGHSVDELAQTLATAESLHENYEKYLSDYNLSESGVSFLDYLGGPGSASAGLATVYAEKDAIQQAETINSLIDQVNTSIGKLNQMSAALSSPTSSMLTDLGNLCGSLGDDGLGGDLEDLTSLLTQVLGLFQDYQVENIMENLLDDTETIGTITADVTKNLDTSLDLLQELDDTINKYVPDAQQALTDVKAATNSAVAGIRDTVSFLSALETLLKKSGGDLDAGTEKMLNGLADSLRRSASGLGQTGVIRSAKDAITSLIDNEWDSHMGEDNRILLMDSSASPVSLTSSQNDSPSSIQVVLRSEEIKVPEESADNESTEEITANGSFLERVAAMFKDFWHAITGLFS
ncbi:hypothetical protein SDC9_53975 [bioreactor metagenome]|uniref:Uncharacterized protein n=1 Tax=bioreactor metagenome TaxID=1076179 RepID=A0A644WW01_9ZZZZ